MIPSDEEVREAYDLIIDAMELNKIPVSVGFSACFGIVTTFLIRQGASAENINKLLDAFEDCLKTQEIQAQIDRLPT